MQTVCKVLQVKYKNRQQVRSLGSSHRATFLLFLYNRNMCRMEAKYPIGVSVAGGRLV